MRPLGSCCCRDLGHRLHLALMDMASEIATFYPCLNSWQRKGDLQNWVSNEFGLMYNSLIPQGQAKEGTCLIVPQFVTGGSAVGGRQSRPSRTSLPGFVTSSRFVTLHKLRSFFSVHVECVLTIAWQGKASLPIQPWFVLSDNCWVMLVWYSDSHWHGLLSPGRRIVRLSSESH